MRSLDGPEPTQRSGVLPRWLKITLAVIGGLIVGGVMGSGFLSLLLAGVGGWAVADMTKLRTTSPPQATPPRVDNSVERHPSDSVDEDIRSFLHDALQDGIIDDATFTALIDSLDVAVVSAPPQAEPSAPQPIAAPPRPTIAPPVEPEPVTAPVPAVVEPPPPAGPTVRDRMVEALRRIWETLVSEFAVHGFVFLVFIGILGFVIFAFAGVESGYRPVAEFVIPIFLFGSAHFLRGRGAPFVAKRTLPPRRSRHADRAVRRIRRRSSIPTRPHRCRPSSAP